MYQSLYDLIQELVFNGTLTPLQDEIVQLVSTFGVLALASLPLLAVCKLISIILGGWR